MSDTIVVCTDDSGGLDTALARAADRARKSGARLLLYDVTAATPFTSPRPNWWAGQGDAEQYDHPLDPVELEKLGRHNLALKLEQVREQGVDAYAWLPERTGGAALADYARRMHARVILLPEALPDEVPELVDSIPPDAPVEYL